MFGVESVDVSTVLGGVGAVVGASMAFGDKLLAKFKRSAGDEDAQDAQDLAAFNRLKQRAARSSSEPLKNAVKDVGTHFFD